ncbi:hypothetical protein A4R26_29965 [Niastella populi]|uniref:Uncharacterized protein n=1 Tax=Niastella populi TaxID=550983 RepID=A0A1V9EWK7_9BACT|nr:hypothetical protein A4R26_29965 [Niastella populi]
MVVSKMINMMLKYLPRVSKIPRENFIIVLTPIFRSYLMAVYNVRESTGGIVFLLFTVQG